ncbi:unnamed protein product [Ixodes persulcatus]
MGSSLELWHEMTHREQSPQVMCVTPLLLRSPHFCRGNRWRVEQIEICCLAEETDCPKSSSLPSNKRRPTLLRDCVQKCENVDTCVHKISFLLLG